MRSQLSRRFFSLALAALVIPVFLACPERASAHGSVTPDEDICIIQIGYFKAHFKMYLPRTRGQREYCEDIPDTGETLFVMQYEHSGLGSVPIDFRVIRNVTGNGVFANLADVEKIESIDSVTVLHHPAKIQPDVFTLLHDFDEQGEFIGIVTATQPDTGKQYTAVFPFQVGFAGVGIWPWFVVAAIGLQIQYLWMSGAYSRWRSNRRRRRIQMVEGEQHG